MCYVVFIDWKRFEFSSQNGKILLQVETFINIAQYLCLSGRYYYLYISYHTLRQTLSLL